MKVFQAYGLKNWKIKIVGKILQRTLRKEKIKLLTVSSKFYFLDSYTVRYYWCRDLWYSLYYHYAMLSSPIIIEIA